MRLVSDEAWAVLTILAEASGEGPPGMTGVAEVIRNRTARKYQSDGTVPGTVLRPRQFSCWNSGDPNRARVARMDDTDPVVQTAMAAWREALAGSELVHGAVLYYNPGMVMETPQWAAAQLPLAVIEHHHFFGD